MKIFDCVTFFEENRQMNLRFNILDNYVDQFVVCEGNYKLALLTFYFFLLGQQHVNH